MSESTPETPAAKKAAAAPRTEEAVSGGVINEADPSWPDEVVQPVEPE